MWALMLGRHPIRMGVPTTRSRKACLLLRLLQTEPDVCGDAKRDTVAIIVGAVARHQVNDVPAWVHRRNRRGRVRHIFGVQAPMAGFTPGGNPRGGWGG